MIAMSDATARLLLGPDASDKDLPRTLRDLRVPPRAVRIGQRLATKRGGLDWEHRWLDPLLAARRQALGAEAAGPPRFLVRVDEFPYYSAFDHPDRFGNESSRRFLQTMIDARLHHLVAILPQLTHDALDPAARGGRPLGDEELALIEEMRASGLVTFAQHGTTHRTRDANPRRHSELCGLAPDELGALLDRGGGLLREVGIDARVLVPPFNRFDAAQWPVLAKRYDVITGGPESIALMGFQGGPVWHGDAVYLPCYAPLYAHARDVLPVAQRLIERAPGTWVPIVLHSMWELEDDFAALRQLASTIAGLAASWVDFLDAVDASRA